MFKELEQCFHTARTRNEALECMAKLRNMLHPEKRTSIKPQKTPFSRDRREAVTRVVRELSRPAHQKQMSVTMKKPEATLGDTSVEASILSNHIVKESTGNARRDSTDLNIRKSLEVKK